MAMANMIHPSFVRDVTLLPVLSSSCSSDEPVALGERVIYLGTDEPEHGTIRWIGKLPEICEGLSVGVELDRAVGAIDGYWNGRQLFACKPNHGIVINVNGLIKEVDFFDGCSSGAASPLTSVTTDHSQSAHSPQTSGLTSCVLDGKQKSAVTTKESRAMTGDEILQEMKPHVDTTGNSRNATQDSEHCVNVTAEELVSEQNGDVEIKKFLSSNAISSPNRSFDRRVYARMFAECEVERWYEALEFDSDGLPDLRPSDSDTKKSNTIGTDVTISSKTKKERGGVFRFLRWLRGSKSSKSSSSSLSGGGGGGEAGGSLKTPGGHSRVSSLDSMTSLSNSFHYIPVGMLRSEGSFELGCKEQSERVYEDLEISLPSSPMTSMRPLMQTCNSLSSRRSAQQNKREQKQRNHAFSAESSSFRRKKRRAPLPPSLPTVGAKTSGENGRVDCRRHLYNEVLSTTGSSCSVAAAFPVRAVVSNLETSRRKMASASTSAIYGHCAREGGSIVSKVQSNSWLVRREPSSPFIISKVHVKNKRKAPPPPSAKHPSATDLSGIELNGTTTNDYGILKNSSSSSSRDKLHSLATAEDLREQEKSRGHGESDPVALVEVVDDSRELGILPDHVEADVSIEIDSQKEKLMDELKVEVERESSNACCDDLTVGEFCNNDNFSRVVLPQSCDEKLDITKVISGQTNGDESEKVVNVCEEIQPNCEASSSRSVSPVRSDVSGYLKFEKQVLGGGRAGLGLAGGGGSRLNEASVDMESLQELVESLVKQYCSNVKANELSKLKTNDDSEIIGTTNDVDEQPMPATSSNLLPKKDMFAVRESNKLPVSLLEEKNEMKKSSEVLTSVPNEANGINSMAKKVNEEVEELKEDNESTENYRVSKKVLPETDCESDGGKGGHDSTDDTSSGIYEPIGQFLCVTTATERNLCVDSVAAPVLAQTNLSGKELAWIRHNPTYDRQEFQVNVVSNSESTRKSEKVIRRLSVNGQRQHLLTGEQTGEEKPDVSAENPRRIASYDEARPNHQFPVYENVHSRGKSKDRTVGCQNGSYFPFMFAPAHPPPPYWNPSYSPYAVNPFSQLHSFTGIPVISPIGGGAAISPPHVCVQPHYNCICSPVLGTPYANSVVAFDPCCTSRHSGGVRKKSISVKLSTNPFLQEDARNQHKSFQSKSMSNTACITSETCDEDDVEGKKTCANPIALKSDRFATKVPNSVPPNPPPRAGSVGRSSRLAARCSFLKESSKFVSGKIENCLGEDDSTVASSRSGDPSGIGDTDHCNSSEPLELRASAPATAAQQTQNKMQSVDDNVKSDADVMAQTIASWDCSVVIGGVKISTPLNLWPLEYQLIASELATIKAVLLGNPIPEEVQQRSDDASGLAAVQLTKQLEVSICNGRVEEAEVAARRLAQLKLQCSLSQNHSGAKEQSMFILNMFVEDNVSHHGPIPIEVNSTMTVGELKKKIFREFEFPTGVQRWILGRKLATCDTDKLQSFGVDFNGCPVFLYLLNPGNVDVKASDLQWCNNSREMAKMPDRTVSSRLKMESEATSRQLKALKTEKKPAEFVDGFLNDLRQPSAKLDTFQAGWHCSTCTLVNVPTRPGCEACGMACPSDYKVPGAYQLQESEKKRLENEKEVDRALELTLKEAEEKERNENLQNYLQLMRLEEQDLVTNEDAFECSICFSDVEPQEGVKLRECHHMFCRDCLCDVISYSEEAMVECPYRDDNYSCSSVLQEREIRSLVPADAYERHLQKSVATAESQAQNSFHCRTPDCTGWCLYDDNVNEFYCPVCGHNNCLTCRVIHERMNCRQYQDRLSAVCNADVEAKKTKEALDEMVKSGEALRCPSCNIIIMKKWGCDWICCSICKLEICWVTKQPRWGPGGRGDMSGGCRCGLRGVRCHPNCNYCH